MFDNKAQSALEYLMTYGWALIVIAIVIGVLIFVTSGATGGAVCQSASQGIVVKNSTISSAQGVGVQLQNATGSDINVTGASAFGTGISGPAVLNGAAITGITVTKNTTFSITGLTAAAGNIQSAGVDINYSVGTGPSALPASARITCSGTIA